MDLYVSCEAGDKEMLEEIRRMFYNAEMVDEQDAVENMDMKMIHIPGVTINVKTVDFIMNHFSFNRAKKNRTLRIGEDRKEYDFKGLSRQQIISKLEDIINGK